MAQQQPRREEFASARRTDHKNEESDQCRDEFGSRTATDPVANYSYGTTGNVAGYGGVPGGGTADLGPTPVGVGYQYTAVYNSTTTTAAPGFGANAAYGTTGVGSGGGGGGGQWGQETGAGIRSGRNTDMGMMNRGRDQK